MRHKFGTAFMVIGAALIAAALALFLWNMWDSSRAGNASADALSGVESAISDGSGSASDDYGQMTEGLVDGYTYIGYITIPTLDLDLPVMSDWSYEQLTIAPCRYYGSVKTKDMVIAAHNYEQHFGKIKNLLPGDAVYFTDMEGTVTAYEVAEVDVLNPYAIEEMTGSGYALTLFTCTYGGASRVTVRCDETS